MTPNSLVESLSLTSVRNIPDFILSSFLMIIQMYYLPPGWTIILQTFVAILHHLLRLIIFLLFENEIRFRCVPRPRSDLHRFLHVEDLHVCFVCFFLLSCRQSFLNNLFAACRNVVLYSCHILFRVLFWAIYHRRFCVQLSKESHSKKRNLVWYYFLKKEKQLGISHLSIINLQTLNACCTLH